MAKRLQVILQDPEYREIQRAAKSSQMSIAEWVRRSLTNARRHESAGDVDKKIAAIRTAAAQNAGTAVEIDTMLAEIEQGYTSS